MLKNSKPGALLNSGTGLIFSADFTTTTTFLFDLAARSPGYHRFALTKSV